MKMLVILGPTATGKTRLAAHLAHRIGGEIISADSRQVFRRMTIGTGKDLSDYTVEGKSVPYHLIDITEPGEEFNVYSFQHEFLKAYYDITSRKKMPILCGGTGLYLESVIKPYVMYEVPENLKIRDELSPKSEDELTDILSQMKKLHNKTDLTSRERIIRAIEIEVYRKEHEKETSFPEIEFQIFGVRTERKKQTALITERLKKRLESGMTEEVKALLDEGISPDQLKTYGLEYKFITQFLLGEIDYNTMFSRLEVAIHQFSKRQMTWFRKMEREGVKIHWIESEKTIEVKVEEIIQLLNG
jgi:tRNA dimethylallyltransferase